MLEAHHDSKFLCKEKWTKEGLNDSEKEESRMKALDVAQEGTPPERKGPKPSAKILNPSMSAPVIHSTAYRKRASKKMKS